MYFTMLGSLIAKELRQTFRDKRMLFLLMVAPLIQLCVLGFAVNMEVEQVPVLLADEDGTPQSRALLAGLLAGDTFLPAGTVDGGEAAAEAIGRGVAPIAVVVPRGYARRLVHGRAATVQVLVDGGDSNRAIVAQNAIAAYVLARAVQLARERLAELARARGLAIGQTPLVVEPRILYNPTLNSQVYFVPGVAATLLLIVTVVVTAMGLAREKELGTLEQVLVTPLGPTTIILGKTLPYAAIGLVDLGLVIAGGAWIFHVPLRGDLAILFAAGLLYLMTVLGIGLLVSTLAQSQQQAFMGAIFFVMPAILLSGFVTPVENMPSWLQPFTVLDPTRHFVEVMRAVLLKDASLPEVGAQLVAMAGLGITVFAGSAALLRSKLG
ncbi:MAG: ABC transporter permease [Deltaproteobacteria bacterium]|nr:ABC transporter permease [Deltaproteobacteria bacterium]